MDRHIGVVKRIGEVTRTRGRPGEVLVKNGCGLGTHQSPVLWRWRAGLPAMLFVVGVGLAVAGKGRIWVFAVQSKRVIK